MAESEPLLMQARVQFPRFDETTPVWANHLTVQFTGSEFVVSFYAAFAPMVTGAPEQRREELRAITEVPARCVAKVIVPMNRMPEFVQAMADNVKSNMPEAPPPAKDDTNG